MVNFLPHVNAWLLLEDLREAHLRGSEGKARVKRSCEARAWVGVDLGGVGRGSGVRRRGEGVAC